MPKPVDVKTLYDDSQTYTYDVNQTTGQAHIVPGSHTHPIVSYPTVTNTPWVQTPLPGIPGPQGAPGPPGPVGPMGEPALWPVGHPLTISIDDPCLEELVAVLEVEPREYSDPTLGAVYLRLGDKSYSLVDILKKQVEFIMKVNVLIFDRLGDNGEA